MLNAVIEVDFAWTRVEVSDIEEAAGHEQTDQNAVFEVVLAITEHEEAGLRIILSRRIYVTYDEKDD